MSDNPYYSEIPPQTIDEVRSILTSYGPPAMVDSTIARIEAKPKNWADFVKDYPYETLLNAQAIRSIVEKYYYNLLNPPPPPPPPPPPTPAQERGLKYKGQRRRPIEGYDRRGGIEPAKVYIYTDKAGNEVESEVDLHSPRPYGGKRKSRRSRKGKKSRKNRRKSKRCR